MKSLHSLLLLSLLNLSCAVQKQTKAKSDDLKLSNLKENEKVIIYFTSKGCFHFQNEKYIFVDKAIEIYNIPISWSSDQKEIIEESPELLGKFILKENQLKKLDKLLLFYAKDKPGGCTTEDKVVIEKYINNELKNTKNYTDASCSSDDQKDLVTFFKLKDDLNKQKK